jgi:hypothetical protein
MEMKFYEPTVNFMDLSDEKQLELVSYYISTHLKPITWPITGDKTNNTDYYKEFLDYEKKVAPNRNKPFHELLKYYMKILDLDKVLVYGAVEMNRQTFHSIYNGDSNPSKRSVFAIAIAMQLSQIRTTKLLHSAGYSFSNTERLDLLIKYCISKKCYEIKTINNLLEKLELGAPLANRPKKEKKEE